jgi:hypothetical protein
MDAPSIFAKSLEHAVKPKSVTLNAVNGSNPAHVPPVPKQSSPSLVHH